MSKHSNPEYAAISLRREYGIDDSQAIDFYHLLPALNITIRESHLPDGTLGACKVKGSHRLIVISTAIPDENPRRFTVAHETGHVILHHGTGFCSSYDIDELGVRTATDKENDANKFAAALLLPEAVVLKELKKNDISFDMAREIANHYGASLTSTLLRLVRSSTDNVCVFLHSGGKIEFSFISPNCWLRPRSGKLSLGALANRLSESEPNVKGNVDYLDWFYEHHFFEESTCTEESRFFPRWQKTLSIINVYSDRM
jgi:Zn-dependent peptidase ImmA (M78 family)